MYTAYYYDPARDQFPGFDSNELSVCGKFVSMITEVRSSKDLSDLAPRTKTEFSIDTTYTPNLQIYET